MHAIRQYEIGPADVLRYEEAGDPRPGPGQVRIAVQAAGVHLIDTKIRSGTAGPAFPRPELPTTPGREVAGVVDEVGSDVDERWKGTRVVALLDGRAGGYAELAVCDVANLHVLPDALAADVAVAMIGTGRTTIAILDAAQLTGDDVALVTAAAGGIGTLLIQAGRNAGATVVGVAGGPAKVDRVRQVGARIAVDYGDPDWPAAVRDALGDRHVTVAFDGVGGDLGRAALGLLAPGGRFVMFGSASASGEPTRLTTADLAARSLTATWAIGPGMFRRRSGRDAEQQALAEAATGRLVPTVQQFPLKDAAEAHAALESRATMGKVVLVP